MGRRNRPCLNQRWSRMDDKTIFSGDKASPEWAGLEDLTPRRRLVYDAPRVPRFTVCVAKEDATWQVMR